MSDTTITRHPKIRPHDLCESRDTAEVGVAVNDFARDRALERRGTLPVQAVAHDADGRPLCPTGLSYPCEILTARQGAHWSCQPQGSAGWWIIYTVRLPAALADRARLYCPNSHPLAGSGF